MCSKEEKTEKPIKKGRKLSFTELRNYQGFENMSEEEADIISEQLFRLSTLCYQIYQTNHLKTNQNGTGKV